MNSVALVLNNTDVLHINYYIRIKLVSLLEYILKDNINKESAGQPGRILKSDETS